MENWLGMDGRNRPFRRIDTCPATRNTAVSGSELKQKKKGFFTHIYKLFPFSKKNPIDPFERMSETPPNKFGVHTIQHRICLIGSSYRTRFVGGGERC
jgi:hypothetical protein